MTKEENVIPTWKQKLLCTGCAAVLAAGLIPMAAWGGATEGSGDVAPAPQALEAENDAGVTTANETGTSDNTQTPGTDTPTGGDQNGNNGDQNSNDNGQGAGDGENGGNGDTNTSMPVEGDDQNQDGNTGEDDGQDNPTGTNGEGDNQEDTDNTSNTGDKATTSNTENVETAEEGTEGPDGSDPTENVDYSEVELTSAGQVTMLSDGVLNLIGQDVFDLNDAGYRYFEENDVFDEYLSATSSNSSVVTVEKMDNDTVAYDSFAVVAHKPGKATITLTLKDKAPVSCEVTVDSYSNVDYSKLKFTQKSITMKANQSEWAGDFYYQYISEEGMEAVGHSFVLGSSDYSILDSYASEGSIIAALRPGVVKLGLYFYNPETDEHILTDTATVTVTSAAGSIGNSTASSSVAGNIMASNEFANQAVKDNNLSLDVQIKKNSELTEAQKKALLIVTDALEGAKAIPVEITLVDQNGRPYDPEAADAGQFAYTVRLKLEGELATLDPATIQVYYLNDYGEPEFITSWVEDGYLYLVTDHFSQYVVTGQPKADASTTAPTTQASNKGAAVSKKQTVTATAGDTLPQAGDESTAVVPVVALSAAAAAAAIYLARRRMQE